MQFIAPLMSRETVFCGVKHENTPLYMCIGRICSRVLRVSELKWLEVRGVFEYDERDPAEMAAALTELYAGAPVVITKKTQRGIGETDIRPAIREIAFADDGPDVQVEALISAQEPTLNPELLAEALRQLAPELAPDFTKFTRVETCDAQMQLFR